MFCEKSKKRNHGEYHKINEILFEWYKRYCASNIYPNGVILKEEAMAIKEQLQNSDFDDFSVSDGWLENNIFRKRTSYCWWGRRRVYRNGYLLDGEDKSIDWWLLTGKHLEYGRIWLFFKALPDKGLVEKGKQAKGGKK